MKIRSITLAFSAGAIAGCMAGGAPSGAQSPAPPPSSSSAAPERRAGALDIGTPLVIDRMDTRIGTTVQFDRIPNASELHDATEVPGLAHVVLSLDGWPTDFAPLQGLDQLPEGADMIVVIPGYPPSTAVAQIWNYLNTRSSSGKGKLSRVGLAPDPRPGSILPPSHRNLRLNAPHAEARWSRFRNVSAAH
ncbi:MAG: hypothetical protein HY076_02295 [Candidatus Eisenbacteria bacterium]|uniref:Uncharacterized protein n=1 Tax=Eiseniibacteriota bacterium TaxID=2212470 RepID=A0A9D6L8Z3_UNCEI|nr:hypothetical protein [Candidatus Eisenbacteria bacterium]